MNIKKYVTNILISLLSIDTFAKGENFSSNKLPSKIPSVHDKLSPNSLTEETEKNIDGMTIDNKKNGIITKILYTVDESLARYSENLLIALIQRTHTDIISYIMSEYIFKIDPLNFEKRQKMLHSHFSKSPDPTINPQDTTSDTLDKTTSTNEVNSSYLSLNTSTLKVFNFPLEILWSIFLIKELYGYFTKKTTNPANHHRSDNTLNATFQNNSESITDNHDNTRRPSITSGISTATPYSLNNLHISGNRTPDIINSQGRLSQDIVAGMNNQTPSGSSNNPTRPYSSGGRLTTRFVEEMILPDQSPTSSLRQTC